MRQRGVALISVLLVVALVTVIASALMARQHLAVRSTQNHLAAKQASQHAQGAEVLAKAILRRDWLQDDREQPVDHLQESWAYRYPEFTLDDASRLNIQIEDQAGRFNLNRLQSDDAALQQFRRLLLGLGIKPTIAESLRDWLDADHEVSASHSAEENHYLLQDVPYRTPNRVMGHISELRLIKDVTFADYLKLEPYVSALPANSALNVNTAPARVLAALAEGLSLDQAEALVKAGRQFSDVTSFINHPFVRQFNINAQSLSVNSRHFRLTSTVTHADRRYQWFSYLERAEDGKVRVLARELAGAGAPHKDEAL